MIKIECETGEFIEINASTLEHVDLSYQSLHRALLGGANLRNACLIGADLRNAFLDEATLENANLTRVIFVAAWCQESNLQQVNMTEALLDGTMFNGSNLQEANLFEARVFGTRFHGVRLEGVDMRCKQLDKAKLRGAIADHRTRWPEGFDPIAHGVVFLEASCDGLEMLDLANAYEGAMQASGPAGELLRKLPDECVEYIGPPPRKSPRALEAEAKTHAEAEAKAEADARMPTTAAKLVHNDNARAPAKMYDEEELARRVDVYQHPAFR